MWEEGGGRADLLLGDGLLYSSAPVPCARHGIHQDTLNQILEEGRWGLMKRDWKRACVRGVVEC